MLKIYKYLAPYRLTIGLIFILLAIQAQFELKLPEYMASIVDVGITTGDIGFILNQGAIMLMFTFASLASTIIVAVLAAKVATKFSRDLRLKVFDKVINFSDRELDEFSTATLITRTTNDITQIQMFTAMFLRLAIYAPILAICGIIKVMNTGASSAWVIWLGIICLLIVIFTVFAIALPRFKLVQKFTDKTNLVLRESLTGITVIRAFGRQKYEEDRFVEVNKDLTHNNLLVSRIMAIIFPVIMLIMNFSIIAIIWISSFDVIYNGMQIGEMMALIDYSTQIITAFLLLSMVFIMMVRASVSANRIMEILESETTIKDPKEPKAFSDIKGEVVFDNVSFKYPGAESYTLENISFRTSLGDTVAFIGGTGSGKSTILKLLFRFYDVTEGAIYVDGVNIKDVKQKQLREKLGYVPQKSMLFAGTIQSNITFENKNIQDDMVIKSAQIAQATNFIEKKENKFKDDISQAGANLSGGQKQRLSIARAIAKDSEILIFDDSFSALDYKTDLELRKSLRKELTNKTYLIVAQRINTVVEADTIIVLENGKIVGKGNHETLSISCDIYKEIAESQI